MRIAIVSDTHGQRARVNAVLDEIAAAGAELILHCGDIDDAATARLFPAHTHFVFGNCDDDREGIRKAVRSIGATLHEGFGHVELAGKNIAFIHGDDRTAFRELENSETFDFLFFGHTHQAGEYQSGRTRVINPGALYRANPKTYALLDLPAGTLTRCVMAEPA